jgi:pimeloyl-ACP methyl ester carboxylesterase/protein-S-isoprenylcysteine O-methyltransferase Ste14
MPHPLPLVLVPGLLCSARLFTPQVAALWPFGPVTVADHRWEDDVGAVAGRILAAAPPRFALAGLSYGGYVALEMVRQAPGRIDRLALLDTSARPDTAEQSEARRKFMAMAQAGHLPDVVNTLTALFLHRNRHRDEALRQTVRDMAAETGVEGFLHQQKAIMTRPDSRPTLARIRCPTLVLVGDGDELTPPELSQEIAAGIAGARLVVVPDCGHLSTIEQPAAVNAALADWLRAPAAQSAPPPRREQLAAARAKVSVLFETRDTAGVLAPPPLMAAAAILLGLLMDWLAPAYVLAVVLSGEMRAFLGIALIAAGAGLAIPAVLAFRAAGTHVEPWKPSSALVTDGILGWLRNPMYVGLIASVAGLAILLASDWMLVMTVAFALALHFGVVLREERYLEAKFGDAYRRYRDAVPRYGWPG